MDWATTLGLALAPSSVYLTGEQPASKIRRADPWR